MKRRSFVKASLATGAAATITPLASMASSIIDPRIDERQLYELRVYILKNDTQQKLVEDYLKNAAIPTLNKLGVKNVGVFTELKPTDQTKIYVLIPYNDMADFMHVSDNLDKDKEYQQQGSAYLNAP